MLIAIDPGPEQSAFVKMDGPRLIAFEKSDNYEMREMLRMMYLEYAPEHDEFGTPLLAIEMIASYGMSVGAEVFNTCVWIGRVIEQCNGNHQRVYRKDVKMYLCGSMRAKDTNIRQRLIDLYGGNEKAIGTKKKQGPLYGVKKDCWSALAVGVTAQKLFN